MHHKSAPRSTLQHVTSGESVSEAEAHPHELDKAEMRVASHPAVQQFYELLALR